MSENPPIIPLKSEFDTLVDNNYEKTTFLRFIHVVTISI